MKRFKNLIYKIIQNFRKNALKSKKKWNIWFFGYFGSFWSSFPRWKCNWLSKGLLYSAFVCCWMFSFFLQTKFTKFHLIQFSGTFRIFGLWVNLRNWQLFFEAHDFHTSKVKAKWRKYVRFSVSCLRTIRFWRRIFLCAPFFSVHLAIDNPD